MEKEKKTTRKRKPEEPTGFPAVLAVERAVLETENERVEIFVNKIEETPIYEFEGVKYYPDPTGLLLTCDLGDYSGIRLLDFQNPEKEPTKVEMPWGGDWPAVEFRRGNVLLRSLGDDRFETPELEVIVPDNNTYPQLFCRFENSGLPAPFALGPVNPYDYRFFVWCG